MIIFKFPLSEVHQSSDTKQKEQAHRSLALPLACPARLELS